MLPTLISDSHDDVPDEWYEIIILQTQRLTRLELTHSPTPSEFDDNNQGLFLLEWRIKVVFSFLCRTSSQDHLLGHTPCSSSSWVHFTCNERNEKVQSRFLSLCKSLIWARLFQQGSVFGLCVLLGPQRRILAHHWHFDIPWEMISQVHTILSGHLLLTRGHHLHRDPGKTVHKKCMFWNQDLKCVLWLPRYFRYSIETKTSRIHKDGRR